MRSISILSRSASSALKWRARLASHKGRRRMQLVMPKASLLKLCVDSDRNAQRVDCGIPRERKRDNDRPG
jgi:hypothetical protein